MLSRAHVKHFALGRLLGATTGLVIAWNTGPTSAQEAIDPVESRATFIDKSAEATDLYNGGKYAEALAMFQSLQQSYADQDADGYVALGLGDCLAALGRIDEARAAYQSAITPDAHRQELIRNRIEELDLKGPITESVLDRLRTSMNQPGAARFVSSWRLARALQKRSADLLAEAAAAFRTAAQGPGEKPCASDQLMNHAAYLDELVADVKFLVSEVESQFNFKSIGGPDAVDQSRPEARTRHAQETIEMPDGSRVEVEIDQQPHGPTVVKINGKESQLTMAQRQLLLRHLDRINQIILLPSGASPAAAGADSEQTH